MDKLTATKAPGLRLTVVRLTVARLPELRLTVARPTGTREPGLKLTEVKLTVVKLTVVKPPETTRGTGATRVVPGGTMLAPATSIPPTCQLAAGTKIEAPRALADQELKVRAVPFKAELISARASKGLTARSV